MTKLEEGKTTLKIAVIGLGSRGRGAYIDNLHKNKDIVFTALCDTNKEVCDYTKKHYGLVDAALYYNEEDFFAKGKIADTLIIATLDQDHFRQAKRALEIGYDLLLEKPVTSNKEELAELLSLATQKDAKVLVCHVLRYAPYYLKIKQLLDEGNIGEIVAINHQENVGFWHFSHSYTRGNWRNDGTSAPSLLAKCCHDFDLFQWFINKPAVKVSSFGGLKFFTEENKPLGATARCTQDCMQYDECPYSMKNIYFKPNAILMSALSQTSGAPGARLSEKIALTKQSDYGKCVFMCDNNVCDHQAVNVEYEGGATVAMVMTAFSKNCFRKIHIMGTKGEIFGVDGDKYLTLNIFGSKSKKVRISSTFGMGHLGGDAGIADTFYKYLTGKPVAKNYLTTLAVTADSHNVVYAAEESRLNSKVVTLKEHKSEK